MIVDSIFRLTQYLVDYHTYNRQPKWRVKNRINLISFHEIENEIQLLNNQVPGLGSQVADLINDHPDGCHGIDKLMGKGTSDVIKNLKKAYVKDSYKGIQEARNDLAICYKASKLKSSVQIARQHHHTCEGVNTLCQQPQRDQE